MPLAIDTKIRNFKNSFSIHIVRLMPLQCILAATMTTKLQKLPRMIFVQRKVTFEMIQSLV